MQRTGICANLNAESTVDLKVDQSRRDDLGLDDPRWKSAGARGTQNFNNSAVIDHHCSRLENAADRELAAHGIRLVRLAFRPCFVTVS